MKNIERKFILWDKDPVCECVFFLNYFNLAFNDILLLRSLFKKLNIKLTLVGPKYFKNQSSKYRDFVYGKCIMGVSKDRLSKHMVSINEIEIELKKKFKDISFYGVFLDNTYYTINNLRQSLVWLDNETTIDMYKGLFFNLGSYNILFKYLSIFYYYKYHGLVISLNNLNQKHILNKII
jgi:hypothetical protein